MEGSRPCPAYEPFFLMRAEAGIDPPAKSRRGGGRFSPGTPRGAPGPVRNLCRRCRFVFLLPCFRPNRAEANGSSRRRRSPRLASQPGSRPQIGTPPKSSPTTFLIARVRGTLGSTVGLPIISMLRPRTVRLVVPLARCCDPRPLVDVRATSSNSTLPTTATPCRSTWAKTAPAAPGCEDAADVTKRPGGTQKGLGGWQQVQGSTHGRSTAKVSRGDAGQSGPAEKKGRLLTPCQETGRREMAQSVRHFPGATQPR